MWRSPTQRKSPTHHNATVNLRSLTFLSLLVYYMFSVKLPAVDTTLLSCRSHCILPTIHRVARSSWILICELRPALVFLSLLFRIFVSLVRPIHLRINGELFLARRGLGWLWPYKVRKLSLNSNKESTSSHPPPLIMLPRCRSSSRYSSIVIDGSRWSGPNTPACNLDLSEAAVDGTIWNGRNG